MKTRFVGLLSLVLGLNGCGGVGCVPVRSVAAKAPPAHDSSGGRFGACARVLQGFLSPPNQGDAWDEGWGLWSEGGFSGQGVGQMFVLRRKAGDIRVYEGSLLSCERSQLLRIRVGTEELWTEFDRKARSLGAAWVKADSRSGPVFDGIVYELQHGERGGRVTDQWKIENSTGQSVAAEVEALMALRADMSRLRLFEGQKQGE